MKSKVAFLTCIALGAVICWRLVAVNEEWNRQPQTVKDVAVRLEHRLETEMKSGDFIRTERYGLQYVARYLAADYSVELQNCVNCEESSFAVHLLARENVELIHQSDEDAYNKAAIAFLHAGQ